MFEGHLWLLCCWKLWGDPCWFDWSLKSCSIKYAFSKLLILVFIGNSRRYKSSSGVHRHSESCQQLLDNSHTFRPDRISHHESGQHAVSISKSIQPCLNKHNEWVCIKLILMIVMCCHFPHSNGKCVDFTSANMTLKSSVLHVNRKLWGGKCFNIQHKTQAALPLLILFLFNFKPKTDQQMLSSLEQ